MIHFSDDNAASLAVILGGLVMIAFMGWAWADSMAYFTRASGDVVGTKRTWFVKSIGGGLLIGGNHHPSHAGPYAGSIDLRRMDVRPWLGELEEKKDWLTETGFWARGFGYVGAPRSNYWHVSLPFSHLMIGFGIAWGGALWWRRKKIRRAAKEMTDVDGPGGGHGALVR